MARVNIYLLSEDFRVLWDKEVFHQDLDPIPDGYALDGMLQSVAFDKYYRSVMRIILLDLNLKYILESLCPHIFVIVINDTFLSPDAFNNLCDVMDPVHKYQKRIQRVLKDFSGIEFRIPPQCVKTI